MVQQMSKESAMTKTFGRRPAFKPSIVTAADPFDGVAFFALQAFAFGQAFLFVLCS